MTDKPTDAVAQARAELEAAMSWLTTDESHRVDALIAAVRAECAAKVRELEAEVERLRAKAAIVDAMERGEIELHRADLHAPGEPRTQWVCLNTTTHLGYRGETARDALAAYAAATREGTDSCNQCGRSREYRCECRPTPRTDG